MAHNLCCRRTHGICPCKRNRTGHVLGSETTQKKVGNNGSTATVISLLTHFDITRPHATREDVNKTEPTTWGKWHHRQIAMTSVVPTGDQKDVRNPTRPVGTHVPMQQACPHTPSITNSSHCRSLIVRINQSALCHH
jgi:hypothetical protein